MRKLPFLLFALIVSKILLAQTDVGVPNILIPGMSADKWLVINPANVHHVDGKFVESKVLRLSQANIFFRDYRFAVPSNATIQGIDVRITRKKKGANAVKDVTVALLKPVNETEATGRGPNLASPELWTETIKTVLYPFPSTATDGSGQVFQWMPADVNHPAFGLFLGISSGTGKGASFLIDKVELTIKYTQGTTTLSQTNTMVDLSTIDIKQLNGKFQVRIKEEGRYLFTVRTTAGVIVQQTQINSGKHVTIPIDSKLKGYYIITVEGKNQVKSQLAYLQ